MSNPANSNKINACSKHASQHICGPTMSSPANSNKSYACSKHASDIKPTSRVSGYKMATHDPSYPPTTTTQVHERDRVDRHAPLSTRSHSHTHRHHHEGAR